MRQYAMTGWSAVMRRGPSRPARDLVNLPRERRLRRALCLVSRGRRAAPALGYFGLGTSRRAFGSRWGWGTGGVLRRRTPSAPAGCGPSRSGRASRWARSSLSSATSIRAVSASGLVSCSAGWYAGRRQVVAATHSIGTTPPSIRRWLPTGVLFDGSSNRTGRYGVTWRGRPPASWVLRASH
ncbi:conserved hypothetical protein (plasmid) [Rhodococcus jostii RHA1]|uniref:Uncharacterized protein n=1 Tax=Rhodococcus jostii (strain RHA1) TaxID=101510 RepID=Q0RY57_RHOJR|nr:conserved hypothetical protein [Rhodococcus jostii RHA1]